MRPELLLTPDQVQWRATLRCVRGSQSPGSADAARAAQRAGLATEELVDWPRIVAGLGDQPTQAHADVETTSLIITASLSPRCCPATGTVSGLLIGWSASAGDQMWAQAQ